jgi:hypothetical protein
MSEGFLRVTSTSVGIVAEGCWDPFINDACPGRKSLLVDALAGREGLATVGAGIAEGEADGR